MTYSAPKPLPETPSSPVLRRLTVDSNAHISTLLQRSLDEEGLDSSWSGVIKGALVDFGEYVESGQILTGLKAARRSHIHARALTNARLREHRRKERDRLKESKAGKSREDKGREVVDIEVSAAPETIDVKLREIHELTSTVGTPTLMDSFKHLFLTVSPLPGTLSVPDTNLGAVPASQGCAFNAETYSFPFYDDDDGRHGEGGVIICGLDNWLPESRESCQRIVGGTFTFQTIASNDIYESLATILRLSIYAYISLVLEQHLLSTSNVILQYPTPAPLPTTSTPLTHAVTISPSPPRKSRSTKPSSGIWSFLSKKTEGIIHRVTGANSVDGDLPRTSSIDLGSVLSSSKSSWRIRNTSEETVKPVHAVSGTESVSNTIKVSPARVAEEEEQRERERFGPFTSIVRRIQDGHCILSTSPQVIFPLPSLIVRLARHEEAQRQDGNVSSSVKSSLSHWGSNMPVPVPGSAHGPPNLRLTGVEKTGLGSVLGWEGREARGKGMASIRSFVRHQGLVVLYTEHRQVGEEMLLCGRPRWMAFRYWSRRPARDTDRDQTLGEFIERSCEAAATEEGCETEGCDQPRTRHSMSWICGGVRIRATIKESTDDEDSDDAIELWQACGVCRKTTKHVKMDDGTYLFSFAKYLELLLWSPLISSLFLCEHITSPSPLSPQAGDPPLSGSRFHILRHFAYKHHILTFVLTSVHNDIYELRLPKHQIISGSMPKEEKIIYEAMKKQEGEEERSALGAQIDHWWQGIKIRLDKLEDFLEMEAAQALESKDLPPLPASDDEDSEDETATSRSHSPMPARPSNSRSASLVYSTAGSLASILSEATKMMKPAAPYPPGIPITIRQSRRLLAQLRTSFQNMVDTLQRQLQDTPVSSLNDVRRAFRSTAKGTCKRLAAWQMKHVPSAPIDILKDTIQSDPEWWSVNCHTVPGGRVVVREGEWGSVIAFTLSSVDYQRELASLNAASGLASSPAASINSTMHSSRPDGTIKPAKSIVKSPDPDESDAMSWEESEPWTTAITRREHPRDVSSLLSLRDVLRTKRSFDSSSLGSRFSGSLSRGVANFTPPSAWAQPQVQVNLQAADGLVSQFPEAAEVVEKVLESQHHLQHAESPSGSDVNYAQLDAGDITPTPSGFVENHVHRGGASTIISFDSNTAPIVAPQSVSGVTIPAHLSGSLEQQDIHPSGNPFSGALSNAMRYFLGSGSPSRGPSPVHQGPHHGLLTREISSSIDDRPHIKYDWTIGKRLKFSCTVYYAKQFDALRKRCGVDNIVIKSLERSENWTAVGGKSKSNFWKSSDDRFIIKTLVNAWHVADLQVLIELAPSYFRYIDSTASRASALAKLMGFYTIEVKNLETGTVQAKHDLLVMENLFYGQKIARTFDLKGIQSRRVKLTGDEPQRRTLFDGEWIEAQQRAPLLIQPHSGHILHEAIKADADFLAKSNIMDYSLLLGIDEESREIACGLVDTIGSYTFAKTLEYKAKQNLNSGKGKEVTVIPPAEYHIRFINSIENYFLTCPDKWTKPPNFIDRVKATDLPSVV